MDAATIRELDVSVLRLKEGDVLVVHVERIPEPNEGEASPLESMAEAFKYACAQAGHEKIGVLFAAGDLHLSFDVIHPEAHLPAIPARSLIEATGVDERKAL